MITDQKSTKQIEAIIMFGDSTDTQLAISKKPNTFRRFLIKLLFGWEIKIIKRT